MTYHHSSKLDRVIGRTNHSFDAFAEVAIP